VNDSDWAIGNYGGGFEWSADRMQILPFADTLQLRDVTMTTTFWLLMGYNFSCVIASDYSDTVFDSRGGFSGSSYPYTKT